MSIFWPTGVVGASLTVVSPENIAPGYRTRFMRVVLLATLAECQQIEATVSESLRTKACIHVPDCKGVWRRIMPLEVCSTCLISVDCYRLVFETQLL